MEGDPWQCCKSSAAEGLTAECLNGLPVTHPWKYPQPGNPHNALKLDKHLCYPEDDIYHLLCNKSSFPEI